MDAAVKVQAAMRGHAVRMMKDKQAKAATAIQALYRGGQERSAMKTFLQEDQAAVRIQSVMRGHLTRAQLSADNDDDTLFDEEEMESFMLATGAKGSQLCRHIHDLYNSRLLCRQAQAKTEPGHFPQAGAGSGARCGCLQRWQQRFRFVFK